MRAFVPPLPLLAGAALVAVVFAVHALSFLPFMADDTFISLRYADRLLSGHGLTWSDHEPAEGYSNLLWVLLVAAIAGPFPLDLVSAARVLNVVCFAGIMLALLAVRPRPDRRRSLLPGIAGALAIAASPPVAAWAIGGLEQPLVGALLALALLGTHAASVRPQPLRRDWLLPGVALGLLCWTRPDGPLLVAGVALGLVLARGWSWPSIALGLRVCLIPIAAFLAQLMFRRLYHGDWLPNTAYAKVAFTTTRLREGLQYLADGADAMPLIPLALAGGVRLLFTPWRRPALLVLPAALLWTGYLAVIGGDIFPAFRHLVPLLVLAAFLLVAGVDHLRQLVPGRTASAVMLVAVAALALLPAHHHDEVKRAHDERWEWDGRLLGRVLARTFAQEQPLLAADAAGSLPFFTRQPAVDMLGLNDRYLAHHRPKDFGRGHLAHELGNGAYVLGRQPDLISFCLPLGSETPCYRSGRELVGLPAFKRQYHLVRLSTLPRADKEALLWLRGEGRVGVRREGDRLRVPGLALAAAKPLLTRPGPDGRLRTIIGDKETGRTPPLRLGAGSWRVTPHGEGPVVIRARLSEKSPLMEGPAARLLELTVPAEVTLEVASAPGGAVELVELDVARE